ncbi:MAG: hypothetical protein ACYDBB_20025 [Armatimonadota bacterium]
MSLFSNWRALLTGGYCLGLLFTLAAPGMTQGDKSVTLVFDNPQMAGISGFRAKWDTPQPDSRVFDAVHRSLLVRFPGMAEQVAAQIARGYTVQKVELVMPFKATEFYINEIGYNQRLSFGVDELYKAVQPQWHAVAWVLRKPWVADKELGPTYNANVNGAAYWAKFGAQDTGKDRSAAQFGPTELSTVHATGNMDITAALADVALGQTLAARLRVLEDCGLLLRKWEVYDFRFRKNGDGAYEWGVATGGRGIIIDPPQLQVTLAPVTKTPAVGKLTPAADIPALVASIKAKGAADGRPTAVMPTPQELDAIIQKFALKRPAEMPEWQWKRVQELDAQGGGYRIPSDPAKYAKWLDEILADPPRYWNGWDVPDRLLTWYMYKDALPAPVQDHIKAYWAAWLMSDRPTSEFEHPQAIELWKKGKNEYYEKTGDWRGNASFFRDGYCYQMSTMNFNHTAAMGALLGGNIVGSKFGMEDGRHGLEYWPLRTWSWLDGSTQESVDHYYFGLTLSDQKLFADFGPSHLDRMMGKIMLAKSVEELTSSYHPALRRFIASSSRTSTPEYLLVTQDALQHIMHSMSRSGALHDLHNTDVPAKAPVIGSDTPPGRVAQQASTSPWAPEWVSNMVDEKPIPYEMTNTYTMWGGHRANPLWRRTYLGKHYGLASTDVYDSVVPILGQWRREDKQVENVQELGTMVMRYGVNTTRLVNDTHGWMSPMGCQAAMQYKNKMVVVTSPYNNDFPKGAAKGGLKSLQSTIAFFNYQSPKPTWEIYVDGTKVGQLPFTCKQGQRITIKDGVSYIGIIPLPATDLGRNAEVTLSEGTDQVWNGTWRAALVIDSYNLKSDTPVANPDWATYDTAYSGFVYEFGDAAEYKSFQEFQKHIETAVLKTNWEAGALTYNVTYTSGADTMEMGVKTNYGGGATPNLFAYRRVNGQWPYLPKGLDRDSTLTQQGSRGQLEKNGATLTCEPGRMAYLQTEPTTGTYAGFNPLPDATVWSLSVPGNVTVTADGRIGLSRIVVRPKENKLWIDYAVKDDQHTADMATALLVFGLKGTPTVEYNGSQLKGLTTVTLDGQTATVIPLGAPLSKEAVQLLPGRYRKAQQFLTMKERPDTRQLMVQDWYVAGPFANVKGTGFATAYTPEKGTVDLKATYTGVNDAQVTWKHVPPVNPTGLGAGSINFLTHIGNQSDVCAYAYTRIFSDRDRAVSVFTGSDDTITVWVNGKQVLAKDVYRGAAPDSEQATVQLKKGINDVLVKVCQGSGGWEFYLRFGEEFGLPLTEGIRYGFAE